MLMCRLSCSASSLLQQWLLLCCTDEADAGCGGSCFAAAWAPAGVVEIMQYMRRHWRICSDLVGDTIMITCMQALLVGAWCLVAASTSHDVITAQPKLAGCCSGRLHVRCCCVGAMATMMMVVMMMMMNVI